MPAYGNYRVYKIVEMRDGCVYKTALAGNIWLIMKPRTDEERNAIAEANGGHILSPPDPVTGFHYGKPPIGFDPKNAEL